MDVRTLLAKIGFEVHDEPLEKLEHTLEGIKERLEIFAGLEVAKKLFEVSEQFAEWGEQLKGTADNLGLNIEELQLLNAVTEQNGVSQGAMSHSLALLSRKLYEVRMGSKEASEAFYKAGINAEQIKGFRNAKDALLAVSDRLAGMSDPIERMAVAQELLGRGGASMVAFLAKGSKVINEETAALKKLGLVLSGSQVAALEEASHSFKKLHMVMHAIGAIIASTIGPAFSYLIDKVVEFYGENKDLISVNIHNWLMNVAYGMGFVTGMVVGLIKHLINLAKYFGVEKNLLKYTAMLGGAAGALTALGVAFSVVSGIFAAAAPFLTFAAIILGLATAVHDLWAVFNDQPTWTGGLIDWVKNLEPVKKFFKDVQDASGNLDFDKLGIKLAGILDRAMDTVKEKMAGLFSEESMGKAGDFMDKLITSDGLTRVVDALAKALDTALIVSGFAIEFGMTIAGAILTGLKQGIIEEFPGLSAMVFGKEAGGGAALSETGVKPDTDKEGKSSWLNRISTAFLSGGESESLSGIAFDAFKSAISRGEEARASHQTVNISTTLNASTPHTDPKAAGEHMAKHVNDHVSKTLRDAKADVQGVVAH